MKSLRSSQRTPKDFLKRVSAFVGKFRLLLLICLSLTSAACSVEKAVIAPPEKRGFIEYKHDAGVVTEQFPFSYTWIKPDLDSTKYSQIIIAPVDVSLIPADEWLKSVDVSIRTAEDYKKKTENIAHYYNKVLAETFTNSDKSRLKLLGTPDSGADDAAPIMTQIPQKFADGTFKLEIALTEIVFGKPLVYAGAFAVPFPGTSYIFDSVSSPMLSMEGRVRDAKSGQIIAVFADRKLPQVKPFDFNKFTASSTLHEVMDRWADEIFRSFNREGNAMVEKTSAFSLIPW